MKKLLCLLLTLVLMMGNTAALAASWKDFQYAREVWAFTADGLARYQAQNGMYGFVNTSGKFVISAIFEEALDFSEGMAAVRRGNRWGFIDTSGKVVIDYGWEDAASFSDGLAAVKEDGMYGYIDRNGEKIGPFWYSSAGAFRDGVAKATLYHGLTCFLDKKGRQVDAPVWGQRIHLHHQRSGWMRVHAVLQRPGHYLDDRVR